MIGLMIDESTDISVTKELILYARVLYNSDVHACFLKIIKIADGKAETIEKALVAYLQECNLSICKISSFGSDGAAVMTGSVTGVATRLKKLNPKMLSIHCINHRLALGVSQAANAIPYLIKFGEVLVSIFKFYHNSSIRQAGLEEIQTIVNDPPLRFKLPSATRWLSHAQAVDAVRRSLTSLLLSLDREASERADPTAVGLLTLCKTYKFVATLMLMSDILSMLISCPYCFRWKPLIFLQLTRLLRHALRK